MIPEALAKLRFSTTTTPLMSEALDQRHWTALEKHRFGRKRLADLRGLSGTLAASDPAVFRFSDFMCFYRTGSRVEFEARYFDHRRRVETFALAVLAGIEPVSSHVEVLENVIWTICDEYSWCLPAHMPLNPAPDQRGHRRSVDLFAAETAFTLAEIVDLLGDRLSPEICARIRSEIEERVLDSYLSYEKPFSWEGVTHNWAAVCAGSIGATALYMVRDPDRLAKLLARLAPSLDSYLSGFADDGACTEGMGYWTYGFGHFLSFADLVKRYDPAVDLLALPGIAAKIEAISLFPQRARLVGSSVIGFSDAFSPFRFPPGFVSYVHKCFPAAELQNWDYAEDFDQTVHRRWSQHLRDFLWFDPDFPEEVPARTASSHFFPQSQWLVATRGESGTPAAALPALAFAAKGGHNDEPHNHNDVGSFMVVAGGENLLDDFGAGLYEKGYFNQDRYTYFIATSFSHSLPLIGGQGQRQGAGFAARDVSYTVQNRADDLSEELSMDIAPAYGIPGLEKLVRRFKTNAGLSELTLSDSFVFVKAASAGTIEIRERFVSLLDFLSDGPNGVVVRGTKSQARISAAVRPDRIELGQQPFMAFGNIAKTARFADFVYLVKPGMGAAESSPDNGRFHTSFDIRIGVRE